MVYAAGALGTTRWCVSGAIAERRSARRAGAVVGRPRFGGRGALDQFRSWLDRHRADVSTARFNGTLLVPPRTLLDRLRSERRWALALFIAGAALIALAQFVLVPGIESDPSGPEVHVAPEGSR